MYVCMCTYYIYVYMYIGLCGLMGVPMDCVAVGMRNDSVCFSVVRCVSVFFFIRGNPEVRCGDNFAVPVIRKGDDTVGSPHRAQTFQFEFFELVLLLKLDYICVSSDSRRKYLSQQYPPPLSGHCGSPQTQHMREHKHMNKHA